MTTCTFSPGNVWHFQGNYCPLIGENLRYYIPKFCVFCNFIHTFCRCLPNAHNKKVSHILHYSIQSPHKHKTMLYCIHTNKKHYKHTSYPTHLKLTVKNKDHAYAEQLIPTVNVL